MKKRYNHILLLISFIIIISACKSAPEIKDESPIIPEEPKETMIQESSETKIDVEKEKLLEQLRELEGENGKAQNARKIAVSLEADKTYPSLFLTPELLIEEAKQDADAQRIESAIAKYRQAICFYNTLSTLMNAALMRREIEEQNMAHYCAEKYVEAELFSLNAVEYYKLDCLMAKQISEQAVSLYEQVLNAGYLEFAKIAKASAQEAKADCDSIKAARSKSDSYNAAVKYFNIGKVEAGNNRFKESFIAYNEAAVIFLEIYKEVSIKRIEAQQAMESANKKQEESSALALEADKEAPLEEGTEGFGEDELDLKDITSPETEVDKIEVDDTSSSDEQSSFNSL